MSHCLALIRLQHGIALSMIAKRRISGAATLKIWRGEDIVPALDPLKDRPDALYVSSDALRNANRIPVNTFALRARLPTMLGFRELAEAGGLMCYGPNYASMFHRAAEYVDKILRGSKPADMPFGNVEEIEAAFASIVQQRMGALL